MIALAFLSGSIPFGLIIGKAKGIDIRKHGSGNIGATNVGRVLGRPYFFLCFALDFLKGFAPTLATGMTLHNREWAEPKGAWTWLGVMVAAVLGHVFSPWLKFKGGKGVATSLGAMMGVFPIFTFPAIGALFVWLIFFAWKRYVSLASIAAGLSLPIFVAAEWKLIYGSPLFNDTPEHQGKVVHFGDGYPYMIVSVLLAALVVWTHRANIKRLMSGTELRASGESGRRVSQQNQAPPPA
jgi:glycerol-3-phosphate acyltransferase PlsY